VRLIKPSRLDRAYRQRAKQSAKRAQKRHKERMLRYADSLVREIVYKRDGGLCRACGRKVKLHGHLLDVMHAHHVIYRSAQGSDAPSNRLSTCASCHEAEHHGLLWMKGQPNSVMTFTRVDANGRILNTWESRV